MADEQTLPKRPKTMESESHIALASAASHDGDSFEEPFPSSLSEEESEEDSYDEYLSEVSVAA